MQILSFFPVNFRSVGQLFQSGFGEGGVGGGASPVCHNMAYWCRRGGEYTTRMISSMFFLILFLPPVFHLFSTCFVEIEDLFEILRRQCCLDTHCKIREIHLTVEAIPTQKRWFFTQCVKNYEADFSRVMMASLRWERRGIWKKQKKYFRPSR